MGSMGFPDSSRRPLLLLAFSLGFVLFALLAVGCGKTPEDALAPTVTVLNEESADLVIALLPERNVFQYTPHSLLCTDPLASQESLV